MPSLISRSRTDLAPYQSPRSIRKVISHAPVRTLVAPVAVLVNAAGADDKYQCAISTGRSACDRMRRVNPPNTTSRNRL
jgi:hypothetical protein